MIVAGNHDSVATLNESRDILAFLNTTVVASAGHAPQILKNATARRAQCCAQFRFYARAISCKAAGLSGSEKQQHLLQAITRYYHQQHTEACALRGDQAIPIIATGHLTTVGASKSDAVREIYIGTLDAFPAQNFPPPTTLPSGIFTGRRSSAAASISATAARPFRSVLTKRARPNPCIW